uniref:hypothetical protein n=1 Tax=Klebsiella pneumoniae TaxID=573 RepID=UPI0025A009C6
NSPQGEVRLRDAETDRRLLFRLIRAPADCTVEVAALKNDFSGGEERQLQIGSQGAGLDMALLIMPYMEQDELPRTAFDSATGK